LRRAEVRADAALAPGIRDRSPHELQRTVIVFPSSDKPTIAVRWLPQLGQTGDGIWANLDVSGS
jgi:hypothetical protein